MPIYEYKCRKCGVHFEVRQSISDSPLTSCRECDGELEKQWSLSGFQFRGEGWYVTDYSSKKDSNGSSKNGASSEKSEKESTTSGEPASKQKTDSASGVKTD